MKINIDMAHKKKRKQLFKAAQKFRAKKEDIWKKCEDFEAGNQWKTDEKKPVTNLVFAVLNYEIPILTDNIPSNELSAVDESREDDVKVMDHAVRHTFEKQSLILKQSIAQYEALKSTTCYYYVDWDENASKGEGEVTIKVLPWRYVWLPENCSGPEDADSAFIRIPISVDEAKRRFPKHAKNIKPSQGVAEFFKGTITSLLGESRDGGIFDNNGNDSESKFDDDNTVILAEDWVKDYSMEPIPEEETVEEIQKEHGQFANGELPDVGKFEDHPKHMEAHQAEMEAFLSEIALAAQLAGEDVQALIESDPMVALAVEMRKDHIEMHNLYFELNPKGERPKYPNGWRVTIEIGDIVVYDGKPEIDDGMIPLAPVYCYKGLGPYSIGEVENLISPQMIYNEMDYYEYANLRLVGHNQKIVIKGAGVKPGQINNQPGKTYEVNPGFGDGIRNINPPAVSTQFQSKKNVAREMIEFISGVREATQGQKPSGIIAADAISRLQEQTNGRIRLKARNYALYTMPRLTLLTASRIQKFWTTERKLRTYDDSGNIQYVKYNPDVMRDLEYEYEIRPSSLIKSDSASVFEAMATLHDRGAITPRELVESMDDLPNRAKLLRSLDERDELTNTLQSTMAENEELKLAIEQLSGGTQPIPVEQPNPTGAI